VGQVAENKARQHLEQAGLQWVASNFKSPGRGGGEIDLIMRDTDGTLVFIEVRHRQNTEHGGAAASVTHVKQRRIVFAARHYLHRLPVWPPCRFDVVSLQGPVDCADIDWLPAAFDASGGF
jgi:putative endonuclease